MNFVVVADPDGPHESYLARGLLRAHGIPALVAADEAVMPSTVTGRVSGTAVLVPPAHAEEARVLLPATAVLEDPFSVEVSSSPSSAGSEPASDGDRDAPASLPGRRAAAPGRGGAPAGPDPSIPIAAMRARRPPWAVAAVVLVLLGVGALLLGATDLLGAGHLPGSSGPDSSPLPIGTPRSR